MAESEHPVKMVSPEDPVMTVQKDQWEMSDQSASLVHVACPVMLAKRVFPVKMVSLAKVEQLVLKEPKGRLVNLVLPEKKEKRVTLVSPENPASMASSASQVIRDNVGIKAHKEDSTRKL